MHDFSRSAPTSFFSHARAARRADAVIDFAKGSLSETNFGENISTGLSNIDQSALLASVHVAKDQV